MRGGRDLFHLLPDAFKGIKQIGVIGWGSQVYLSLFYIPFFILSYFVIAYMWRENQGEYHQED